MKTILETDRLILREFTLDDRHFIISLLNSPGWLQFIGDRNVHTEDDAIAYLINGPIKSYQQYGYGLSLVELKETHNPIGMCGIINREALENPDIGFAFMPNYCGFGYAYEIASATIKHAKTKLGLSKICAITVKENTNSIRLLEKLGLTFVKPFNLPGSTETLQLYCN